jgi:hypothetical protein
MAPLVAGSLTAAITLSDNATGSPQSIALNGTGVTPAVASLSLSSTSLSFGGEPVGDSTVAQSVTLTNTSAVVLYFNSTTLTGANASSLVTFNSCGTSIAAGATCKIGVRMAPLVSGSLTAEHCVEWNGKLAISKLPTRRTCSGQEERGELRTCSSPGSFSKQSCCGLPNCNRLLTHADRLSTHFARSPCKADGMLQRPARTRNSFME